MESKEQEKREREETKRQVEKKVQKERERKEQEAKKKFKVSVCKSLLFSSSPRSCCIVESIRYTIYEVNVFTLNLLSCIYVSLCGS